MVGSKNLIRSDRIQSDLSRQRLGLIDGETPSTTGNRIVDDFITNSQVDGVELSDGTLLKRYGVTSTALNEWSTAISRGEKPECDSQGKEMVFENIQDFIDYVLALIDTGKNKKGIAPKKIERS